MKGSQEDLGPPFPLPGGQFREGDDITALKKTDKKKRVNQGKTSGPGRQTSSFASADASRPRRPKRAAEKTDRKMRKKEAERSIKKAHEKNRYFLVVPPPLFASFQNFSLFLFFSLLPSSAVGRGARFCCLLLFFSSSALRPGSAFFSSSKPQACMAALTLSFSLVLPRPCSLLFSDGHAANIFGGDQDTAGVASFFSFPGAVPFSLIEFSVPGGAGSSFSSSPLIPLLLFSPASRLPLLFLVPPLLLGANLAWHARAPRDQLPWMVRLRARPSSKIQQQA